MKKYFWITIATAGSALSVFFIVTVILFFRGLDRFARTANERMTASGGFAASYIDRLYRSGGSVAAYEDIEIWLTSFAQSTGFERIMITDSLGLVLWSSGEYLNRGDDVQPYLTDAHLFDSCLINKMKYFTDTKKIDGVSFKSLFYPCYINDESCVVIVEADQEYFSAVQQFSHGIFITTASLGILLLLMLAGMLIVDTKARKAAKQARDNEHLAFLGRTSAELAHELKNPLAIIKSSVDVLQKKYDPEKKEEPFSFISGEIMQLSEFINDILSFSHEKRIKTKAFSLADTIKEFVRSFSGIYPEMTVKLSIPNSLIVTGDIKFFEQITGNLLRNASEATEGHGTVLIKTEDQGKSLDILFTDNGPGIPTGIVDQIFNPFVSGTKNSSGLGLSITKRLCESMNWNICLDSHKQGNNCFVVTVPEDLWEKS